MYSNLHCLHFYNCYMLLYTSMFEVELLTIFLKSYSVSEMFTEFLCVCVQHWARSYRTHKEVLLKKLASGWREKKNLENHTRQ